MNGSGFRGLVSVLWITTFIGGRGRSQAGLPHCRGRELLCAYPLVGMRTCDCRGTGAAAGLGAGVFSWARGRVGIAVTGRDVQLARIERADGQRRRKRALRVDAPAQPVRESGVLGRLLRRCGWLPRSCWKLCEGDGVERFRVAWYFEL